MFDLDRSSQAHAVRSVLAQHGPRAALAMLNDRTSFRFTALYRLSDGEMRATHAYDRTSEYRTWLSAVPLESSFCRFAIEHGEFMTESASADERLARPYAGLVESYYGCVLHREDGTPWGTFIHFDLEPRSIDEEEQDFLRDVVPLFAEHLS